MFRINLGNYILYKGKKYLVSNGVDYLNNKPAWKLAGLGYAPRDECKLVLTFNNILHSFK
ncbi:unnamed protein product, partial [marine sediment metagenome]